MDRVDKGEVIVHLGNATELSKDGEKFTFGDLIKVDNIYNYLLNGYQQRSLMEAERARVHQFGVSGQTNKLRKMIQSSDNLTQPSANILDLVDLADESGNGSEVSPSGNFISSFSPSKSFHSLLTETTNLYLHGKSLERRFNYNKLPSNKHIAIIPVSIEFDPGRITRENYVAEACVAIKGGVKKESSNKGGSANLQIMGIAPMGFAMFSEEINSSLDKRQIELLGDVSALNILARFGSGKIEKLIRQMKMATSRQEYSVVIRDSNSFKVKYHGYRDLDGRVRLPYRQYQAEVIVLFDKEDNDNSFGKEFVKKALAGDDEEKTKVINKVFGRINGGVNEIGDSFDITESYSISGNTKARFTPVYDFESPIDENHQFSKYDYSKGKVQNISFIRSVQNTNFKVSKVAILYSKSKGDTNILRFYGSGFSFIANMGLEYPKLSDNLIYKIEVVGKNFNFPMTNKANSEGYFDNNSLIARIEPEDSVGDPIELSKLKYVNVIVRLSELVTGKNNSKLLFSGPVEVINSNEDISEVEPINTINSFKFLKKEILEISSKRLGILLDVQYPESDDDSIYVYKINNTIVNDSDMQILETKPIKNSNGIEQKIILFTSSEQKSKDSKFVIQSVRKDDTAFTILKQESE